MQYRRANVKGGTYYFTVNLAERHLGFLVDHVNVLRAAVSDVRQRHPFHIDAFVVLPDYLHAIWTLPEGNADFATRWMLIKAGFSRHIAKGERRNPSRVGKGERGIWQRQYREHMIRDDRDYERHVDYAHYNPVKHGYVECAAQLTHWSIHRFIASGTLSPDWGGDIAGEGGYGER